MPWELMEQVEHLMVEQQEHYSHASQPPQVNHSDLRINEDHTKLKELKPLTEPMGAEFAHAARLKLDATWGVAELGAAGPKGTPYGHAPGTSVIGISGPVNMSITVETSSENREENMFQFTEAALTLFNTALTGSFKSNPGA